jgi:hypothetical protein
LTPILNVWTGGALVMEQNVLPKKLAGGVAAAQTSIE